MFFNHSVSDLVSRIKNGYLAKRSVISSPISSLRENILQILKNEGYILSYTKDELNGAKKRFTIHLKYHHSAPVVDEIEVISKPGKRIYCKSGKIPFVKNGLGVTVLSTSQGLLPDYEARSRNLGGELLLKVF